MAVRVKRTFFWEVEGTRWPLTFGDDFQALHSMFVKIKSAMLNGGTQCFSLMKCDLLGEFCGLYSRACVFFSLRWCLLCLKPVPEEVYFASRVFTRGGQVEEDSASKAGIGTCVMG